MQGRCLQGDDRATDQSRDSSRAPSIRFPRPVRPVHTSLPVPHGVTSYGPPSSFFSAFFLLLEYTKRFCCWFVAVLCCGAWGWGSSALVVFFFLCCLCYHPPLDRSSSVSCQHGGTKRRKRSPAVYLTASKSNLCTPPILMPIRAHAERNPSFLL